MQDFRGRPQGIDLQVRLYIYIVLRYMRNDDGGDSGLGESDDEDSEFGGEENMSMQTQ